MARRVHRKSPAQGLLAATGIRGGGSACNTTQRPAPLPGGFFRIRLCLCVSVCLLMGTIPASHRHRCLHLHRHSSRCRRHSGGGRRRCGGRRRGVARRGPPRRACRAAAALHRPARAQAAVCRRGGPALRWATSTLPAPDWRRRRRRRQRADRTQPPRRWWPQLPPTPWGVAAESRYRLPTPAGTLAVSSTAPDSATASNRGAGAGEEEAHHL